MERKDAIEILTDMYNYYSNTDDYGSYVPFDKEDKEALEMAINSLKTDEAYQLEYEGVQNIVITEGMTNSDVLCRMFPNMHYTLSEKTSRVVTTIGIAASFNLDWWNAEYKESTTLNDCENCIHNKGVLECDIYRCKYEPTTKNNLRVTSGLEKNSKKLENVNPIIDWNNCHTSEQLDSITTAKNNLGVDAVSRQAVLELIADYDLSMGQVVKGIHALPSVTPQEPRWIPCSEKLPKAEYGESGSVLVCFENGTQDVLYFNGSNWCYPTGEIYISVNHKNGWHNKVIAWMPLPTSYSEVEV